MADAAPAAAGGRRRARDGVRRRASGSCPVPAGSDTVVPQWEFVLFLASLPVLGIARPALRALRPRRGEDGSLLGGRLLRRAAGRDHRHVDLSRRHLRHRSRASLAGPARRVLGFGDRVRLSLPRRPPLCGTASGGIRSERADRRLRASRAPARRRRWGSTGATGSTSSASSTAMAGRSRTAGRRSSSSGRRASFGSSCTNTGSTAS